MRRLLRPTGAFQRGFACLSIGLAFGVAAQPAFAVETITYTYDVHGRIVTVVHSGTINNGLNESYSHDAADNRTNVTVTGSPN